MRARLFGCHPYNGMRDFEVKTGGGLCCARHLLQHCTMLMGITNLRLAGGGAPMPCQLKLGGVP